MSPIVPSAMRARFRAGMPEPMVTTPSAMGAAPMLTKRRPVDFCLVAASLCRCT